MTNQRHDTDSARITRISESANQRINESAKRGAEEYSIEYLKGRVVMGSVLVKLMVEGGADDEAVKVIQDQQREINRVLVEKIRAERAARGEAEPAPVVVGLGAVRLSGRAMRG